MCMQRYGFEQTTIRRESWDSRRIEYVNVYDYLLIVKGLTSVNGPALILQK